MHMIIYALVAASTTTEALTNGKAVFDRLVGAGPHGRAEFDYYVTFDDDTSTVAGKARWGDLPVAAPIESADGQTLLERGWSATESEFQRNLDRVKEALRAYDDEEIMHNEDLVRLAFHNIGAYAGPSVSLYDEHAGGIRHREHLDRVLERHDELWIVPADVHY